MKILSVLTTSLLLLMACNDKEKPKPVDKESQSQQWVTGVALYSFNQFPLAESLDKAHAAGAGYVEGFSFHKLGKVFNNQSLLELSEDQLEQMKEMIKARELKMWSMYAAAETEAEWKQMFSVGRELGVKFLVGEPKQKHLDLLNRLAGKYDIQVAIHQHAKGSSRYWHPDSVLTALKGRQHLGVCADLGHWVRSELDPVESLQKLEGHIISVHAKDLDTFGNIEAKDVRISSGVIDYQAVVGELSRQGFRGPVYIEAEHDWEDNIDDVRYAVEYLNGLKAEYSEEIK